MIQIDKMCKENNVSSIPLLEGSCDRVSLSRVEMCIRDRLSSEQQQILLDCAQEAADEYNEKCYAEFEEYRPTMIEEGAIFLDIDRQEWIDSVDGFYTQLKEENFFNDPELLDYAISLKEGQ